MTTLALLKTEIADDLERNDVTDAIATYINAAIRHYQRTRFYFNETRDVTFSTVAAQKLYTSADSASIPKFITIDQIYIDETTGASPLDQISPSLWEQLTADGSATGKPESYCYFNRSLGFYSIPGEVYTVRMIGHIMKDAPATDDEASNVWMLEAFDLLKARVCSQLCLRRLRDQEGYQIHSLAEDDEKTRLLSETNSRVGTGFLVPTDF